MSTPVTSPPRTPRSRRTREAVVQALEDLVLEGSPSPSAGEIAERAGISLRSVYVHFASVDDLHLALTQRATQRVLTMLCPIDVAAPFAERTAELVRQRARINEEIGPLRRAAALHAAHSPPLAEARALARRASLDQVRRVFAAELAAHEPGARRRAASVDATLSGEHWDVLRTAGGLGRAEAERAVREAVTALLAH